MNETKDAYKLDEFQGDLKKIAEAFSREKTVPRRDHP